MLLRRSRLEPHQTPHELQEQRPEHSFQSGDQDGKSGLLLRRACCTTHLQHGNCGRAAIVQNVSKLIQGPVFIVAENLCCPKAHVDLSICACWSLRCEDVLLSRTSLWDQSAIDKEPRSHTTFERTERTQKRMLGSKSNSYEASDVTNS